MSLIIGICICIVLLFILLFITIIYFLRKRNGKLCKYKKNDYIDGIFKINKL